MTKAQRTKILNALKKLQSWKWYSINPRDFTREEMIEVLKWSIDEGTPYNIRGDWLSFRLETKGGPLWQQREELPEGVTLQFITAGDDTSFVDIKGRKHECRGPAHVVVWKDGKIIGIENNLQTK